MQHRNSIQLGFLLYLTCIFLLPMNSHAGDEDGKSGKKKSKPLEELTAPIDQPEAESPPDLSLGSQPPPVFEAPTEETPSNPMATPSKRKRKGWIPDKNIDFSELYDTLELPSLGEGTLPPALGFRGYRPSMMALSYGDRTPGWGGVIEYSWNRIGAGITGAYRTVNSTGLNSSNEKVTLQVAQSFFGVYGIYRWLPFAVSPYLLLGLEGASNTFEPFGGMAGVGIEANVHLGWTMLLGYTFHSTIRDGSLGGGLGWSF